MKIFYILIFSVLTLVSGEEYHVDKSAKNEVKFISDAPIENFEGVTDQIDGYLYHEDDSLTTKSQLYFEVNLNTLDTGIGLRNRHMRDNYLHTDKYPTTYYKGKIIKAEKIDADSINVISEGTIFIHGVEKPIKVKAKMFHKEDRYHIHCNFNVKLSDFNIEIPSIMFYKINENMDLQLDFYIKLFKKN
ncbi:MAG: YceI family protein [Calditrichaceae bacterium]